MNDSLARKATDSTNRLVLLLRACDVHAAIIGTGGNHEAVEVRLDDNYGIGLHVLITNGDAGLPFGQSYDWTTGETVIDRETVAIQFDSDNHDDGRTIMDSSESTVEKTAYAVLESLRLARIRIAHDYN